MDTRPRVVIADAERDFRQLLADGFRDGDFEIVHCTGDGLDALSYIAENKTELLICDHVLARLDGLDLVECARGLPDNMRPAVIFTSYLHAANLREDALARGAEHFLPKPFSLSRLTRFMRVTLDV